MSKMKKPRSPRGSAQEKGFFFPTRRSLQTVAVAARTQIPRIVCPSIKRYDIADFRYLDDSDTLGFLERTQIGMVRMGNSELTFMAGRDVRHQIQNRRLRRLLMECVRAYNRSKNPQEAGFLLCLPLDQTIGFDSFEREKNSAGKAKYRHDIWQRSPRFIVEQIIEPGTVYGSPSAFRFGDAVPTTGLADHISGFIRLVNSRPSLYIGPEIDHDIVKRWCPAVKTLAIPPKNAFSIFDKLFEASLAFLNSEPEGHILITAGLTGTALSFQLNKKGARAFDVGQSLRQLASLD